MSSRVQADSSAIIGTSICSGHLGELGIAGDRLLAEQQPVLGLAIRHRDRLGDARVALVAIDADLDGVAELLAQAAHQLDVALAVEAGLALDRLRSLGHCLLGLLKAAIDVHDPERVRELDAVAPLLAAEQLPDRNALRLAGDVVGGNIERGLRVGVALDRPVHGGVQHIDRGGIGLGGDYGRQQVILEDVADRLRGLAVVAHRRAAPGRDRRRLAPAAQALVGVEPQDRVVADRHLHLRRPGVLAPSRE